MKRTAWALYTALLGLGAYWLPLLGHPTSCGRGSYTSLAQALVFLLVGLSWSAMQRSPSAEHAGAASSSDPWPGLMTGWIRWFGPCGLGFLLGWMHHVDLPQVYPKVYTCSHQLLPFEGLFLWLLVLLPTRLGAFVGRRWQTWTQRPLAAPALLLATAVTLLTPYVLPLQLWVNERHALNEIVQLGQRQLAYQRAHPQQGFACELTDISSEGSVSATNGGQAYYSDGYSHELLCYRDAAGRVHDFALWLTPFCVQNCGHVQYCLSARGEVRALPRDPVSGRWGRCWTEGTVVATLPGR